NANATYAVKIDEGALLDSAGNSFAGIDNTITVQFTTAVNVDTSIVGFDLVAGKSSSHSGRVFDSEETYTVYIRVDSDSYELNTSDGPEWGIWTGSAGALGTDDKIIFVGDGEPIEGRYGNQASN